MNERLLEAVRAFDLDACARLVDSGAADDLSADEKRRLVWFAAESGRGDLLRFLFERHLHNMEPDARGRNLLHAAASSGDAEAARFALEVLGLDPAGGDECGVTPLDLAGRAGDQGAFSLLSARLGFTPARAYRNPVLRGCHPDPSVVRVGKDFYLINSSFAFFPGLPIYHSEDLVHWREISHAIEDLETSGLAGLPGGFGYWAPDISCFNGRFWVVATLRRPTRPYRLQMITSAADPRGPWETPRFLPLDGIDPSLFVDDDGRRYILLNPGAMIAELSESGELLSGPRMLTLGFARIKPEGPHLLKKDGWYYLFLAEGGTGMGHMETVLRSRSLMGPYEGCPFNPILGRKNLRSPIQRSGHGKPVQLPDGRWYMPYLCSRPVEGMTLMGRETGLDPIEWTADGWPMVNRLKGPSCLQALPYPDAIVPPAVPEAAIAPRNDPRTFARFVDGRLCLRCGPDPAATSPCSLLLRRQSEPVLTRAVRVDMRPADEGDLGALTGYYDEQSFYLFGLRKEPRGCSVVLEEQVGDRRTSRVLAAVDGPEAALSAQSDGLEVRLFLEGRPVAALRTEYLCDEGLANPKRFTGAMVGLAAVGAGQVAFEEAPETACFPARSISV